MPVALDDNCSCCGDRCPDDFVGWLLAGSLAVPLLFIWLAALLGW